MDHNEEAAMRHIDYMDRPYQYFCAITGEGFDRGAGGVYIKEKPDADGSPFHIIGYDSKKDGNKLIFFLMEQGLTEDEAVYAMLNWVEIDEKFNNEI